MTDYKVVPKSTVDELAQFIRKVDGNQKMGAGALAEKICERFRVDTPAVQGEPQTAEQQPAPDVAGLVEALEFARDDLQDWMESFPDAFHDPTVKIIERIDAALAAHRKKGGSYVA